MEVCVYERVELNMKAEEHGCEWIWDNIQDKVELRIALYVNCRLLDIRKNLA